MCLNRPKTAGVNPKSHKRTLVLLHGWGYDNTCWPQEMLQQLRVDYELIVLDLPGHGQDPSELNQHDSINQLDEWIRVTKARLPQRYDLMGWSLGGQIAIRMAHNDSRIQRLILMAVNPKFISSNNWPKAMLPKLLLQFDQGYQALAEKTLRRFAMLQAQGAAKPKPLGVHLMNLMLPKRQKILGLKLLYELDERDHLCQLSQPCFLELADADELVPNAWVRELKLPNNVQIHAVSGGHAYFLETQGVGANMARFLRLGVPC